MNILLKVAALIKNKEGQILLIKEKYTEVQGYKWNLVKGTYDISSETLQECVIREIYEEVGLKDINKVTLSWIYHYGKPENPKILFIFDVKYSGNEHVTTQYNKEDENVCEVKWFTQEELQLLKQEDCMAEYVYTSINNSGEDFIVMRRI